MNPLAKRRPRSALVFCFAFGSWLAGAISSPAAGKPEVRLDRHAPCNLFAPAEAVTFAGQLAGFAGPKAEITVSAVDYWGNPAGIRVITVNAPSQSGTKFDLPMGSLPTGYYELTVRASGQGADGAPAAAECRASFGVVPFVHRSAKEAREGGYLFGLKWGPGIPNPREAEEMMVKLGLQWTRIIHNAQTPLSTTQMLTEFPMNAVIKVERFPQELYDEARYGPLAEWEKKFGRGAWTLKTLPKKEPYQAWLRQEISKNVPADQNVFEVWNEPWDKMSPEDFATLSQWIVEVIARDRPNAVIGPNLTGNSGEYEYDARVIAAGGLKGMRMVALHPYGNSEDRAWLRKYRQWLKQKTSREMEIYITEYGSHSTPEGPAKRTEQDQARRVARQSLSLYAEGVRALIPHWVGQSEQNRTYLEDWFGFIRKNGEAKPVLLAHATAARLVDGSRYLGDLWYGPQVAAMLFEKKGVHTLVLWTLGAPSVDPNAGPAQKEVEIMPGKEGFSVVDIVGRETRPAAAGGKLKLTLTEGPTYVVGVSPELAAQASQELRPDRWPKPEQPPRLTRVAHRVPAAPTFDGKFGGWKGMTEIDVTNPKVAGGDCSGTARVAWDDEFLYFGADLRDNEMLNIQPRAKLYSQDSVELFITTEPRDQGSGYGPRDHQFFLTPTSGEGHPILAEVTDHAAGKVVDVAGAKFFGGRTEQGWAVQAAIPWSALAGFKPAVGARLALEFNVNDADTSHPRFKLHPGDTSDINVFNPSTWSYLKLEQ